MVVSRGTPMTMIIFVPYNNDDVDDIDADWWCCDDGDEDDATTTSWPARN